MTFKMGDIVFLHFRGNLLAQLLSSPDSTDGLFMYEILQKEYSDDRAYSMSTDTLMKNYHMTIDTVLPDRISNGWVHSNEITIARVRNSALARKLHPKYREEEEWLYLVPKD